MKRSELAVWGGVAALLAVAGVVGVLVRPLAPALGPVATDLDRFDPALLETVRAYRSPRYVALVAMLAATVLVPAWFAWTGAGRRALGAFTRPARRPLLRAGAAGGAIALATAVVELPLAYWLTHVHERRWGFSTASVGQWFRDWAVVVGFATVVAVVGAIVFVWVRGRWPRSWHFRLVAAGTALTALLALVYPFVVQPLLLPTEPLGEGPVRDEIRDVLRRAGAEDLEILVGDASRRTTKVNAFVTGIGPSRQVVLFDTLLELPSDHVAVVVAHELAHREHRDVARAVLVSATGLFVGLLVLRRLVGPSGSGRQVGDVPAVAVLAVVLAAGQIVAAPAANWASRRAEAAADHRALELTEAAPTFVATQRGFVARDLADPSRPWWVTALWGTHPTIEDRIRAAVGFAEERGIGLPTREELQRREPPPRVPR